MTTRRNPYFMLGALMGFVLVIVFAHQARPASLTSDLALRDGHLKQEGNRVEFTVRTARPVALDTLEGLPDESKGSSRYLCLELSPEKGSGKTRVCAAPGDRVGITAFGDGGSKPVKGREIEAEIEQPAKGRMTVSWPFRQLDLDPGRYRFRLVSSDGSCGSKPDEKCVDVIPAAGKEAGFNLRIPALVGCTDNGGREVRYGSRETPTVALTFDDGPGVSTPEILEILRHKRVDATFFLLGSMVSKEPEMTRQIATQGSEVANHSTAHDARPTLPDLEQTNAAIEAATEVKPCAFRPPYGDVDSALVARARTAGLDTVLWDVDTDDWQGWTTVDSILENVKTNTTNGSIILMHDGGDQRRSKTIELLPKLIDMLRQEGYGLVTVSELLGSEITWEPLGNP